MRTKIRNAAVAATVATLALGGVGACTGGGDDDRQTRTSEQEERQEQRPAHDPDPFNDGRRDVTLKSCKLGDPWELGEAIPVVDLAIVNSSSKRSDYVVEIEVTGPDGDRIETMYTGADGVAPGQTVDTGDGDGEEDSISTESGRMSGPIKCSIVSADRMPTP